jgi:hypothetical protein
MKVRDIITENTNNFNQQAAQYFKDEQLGMADQAKFNNWVRTARDKRGNPFQDFGNAMIAYQKHLAKQAGKQATQQATPQPAQDTPKTYSDKFRGNQYTGGFPGQPDDQPKSKFGKAKDRFIRAKDAVTKAKDAGSEKVQKYASRLNALSNFDLKDVGRV